MKIIELTDPDDMDRAFMQASEARSTDKGGDDPDPEGFLSKRTMTDKEAGTLIRWYNGIFKPTISTKVRCGGTLNLIQKRLREYYGL